MACASPGEPPRGDARLAEIGSPVEVAAEGFTALPSESISRGWPATGEATASPEWQGPLEPTEIEVSTGSVRPIEAAEVSEGAAAARARSELSTSTPHTTAQTANDGEPPGAAGEREAAMAAALVRGSAAPDLAAADLTAAATALDATTAEPGAAQAATPERAIAEPQLALEPLARLDPNDYVEQTDLWDRLRRGFAMPDLDGRLVRAQERWYAARPEYVQRMTERAGRYLFHIVEEVERRGLPTELALLPFIESAFNPEALSHARASGMWQFIPSTGLNFDLKQNVFRDDRRDVLASTRAALDYLEMLYGMFGDWHLALAAYNWGEGSVAKAVQRNRRARKPEHCARL